MDAIATSWESRFKRQSKKALEKDRRNVLAILEESKSLSLRKKQTIDWQQIELDWNNYFENEAPENWRDEFFTVLKGVMADAAEMWVAETGIAFNVQNLFIEPSIEDEKFFAEWFNEYLDTFSADILQTTQDDLRKILIQANNEGWTIDQVRKQIGANFKRYVTLGFEPTMTEQELEWFRERLPQYRLESIARSESLRAANLGSFELFKAWNVTEFKEWLDSKDDRVRPTHVEAGASYVVGGNPGPIPLNEPFRVGDSLLMYPGDRSLGASPEETIQCRCSLAPVVTIP